MSDNNNGRPISTGSQGTPVKSFTTNNVKSNNQSFPNSRSTSRVTTDSKPKTVQTPTKKGK